jgi:plastocyanin
MLHNQLSKPDNVWMTYDIDFIPATAPASQNMQAARPIWMDVRNPSGYPVFDVIKGTGKNGVYTYPDDATNPYGAGPPRNQFTVPQDGVLLATAGHVHPGGMHDDLWLTRNGVKAPAGHAKPGSADTVRLFRSDAKYFEPAGGVSWDVSMTATPTSWRPAVHKGDVLSISSTYDSKNGSWYESMGIMVVWMADGTTKGVNPFAKAAAVDVSGVLTHGHLAENNNHGGKPDAKHYQDVRKAPSRVLPSGSVLPIADFAYTGDMSVASTVPAVEQGGTLTFRNDDAANAIWHTVTSCTAPCDRSTGIAYPLADTNVLFDSGELGHGGPPAAGRITFSTPSNLPPGTYTYFCRIHPFMRGAFRVVAKPH